MKNHVGAARSLFVGPHVVLIATGLLGWTAIAAIPPALAHEVIDRKEAVWGVTASKGENLAARTRGPGLAAGRSRPEESSLATAIRMLLCLDARLRSALENSTDR